MKEAYRDSLLEDLKDPPKAMGPPVKISIFVDATLASQKDTAKSVTGLIVYIGDMFVKFSSKRQKSVATSTYSAEFVALRIAFEEAISAKHLIQSIGVNIDGPVDIYCDNESVIKSAIIVGGELK